MSTSGVTPKVGRSECEGVGRRLVTASRCVCFWHKTEFRGLSMIRGLRLTWSLLLAKALRTIISRKIAVSLWHYRCSRSLQHHREIALRGYSPFPNSATMLRR